MLQRAAQKRKVTVTSKIAKRSKHRRSKIAERSKHRVAILRRSRSDLSIEDREAIRLKHREHREAMRSKIAKRCYRSIAKRCSRGSKHREAIETSRNDRSIAKRCSQGIADDDAPGVKGRSPPARHHRAIADAPRGIILLTSRVSIYLYITISYENHILRFLISRFLIKILYYDFLYHDFL